MDALRQALVDRMVMMPHRDALQSRHVKLRDLAERLDCRLEGDGDIEIARVAGIQDAGAGDVTFLANPKYEKLLRDDAGLRGDPQATTRRRAAVRRCCARGDPYLAFARAVGLFAPGLAAGRRRARPRRRRRRCARSAAMCRSARSSPSARARRSATARSSFPTSPSARARESAATASSTRTSRFASASRSATASSCRTASSIGGDGYGFVRRGDGTHEKIPQIATVVIEDDVELGANTTVDRPAVGETRIKAGTKIDNLVQIGHGVTRRPQRADGRAGRHCRQHRDRTTTWCSAGRSASAAI